MHLVVHIEVFQILLSCWYTSRLNFRTAPYFIMHAGHCQRKIMAKTMQQLWDYALFLLFLSGETKDCIH